MRNLSASSSAQVADFVERTLDDIDAAQKPECNRVEQKTVGAGVENKTNGTNVELEHNQKAPDVTADKNTLYTEVCANLSFHKLNKSFSLLLKR